MDRKFRDKLVSIVNKMTDEQRVSALRYLTGYDTTIAATVIQWTLSTYPVSEIEPVTDEDIK
jgi:hypothetical protein